MQRMAIVYKGHSYSNFEVNVVVLFCLTVVTKCKYILLRRKCVFVRLPIVKNSAYLSVHIFASGIVVEWCCFPEGNMCQGDICIRVFTRQYKKVNIVVYVYNFTCVLYSQRICVKPTMLVCVNQS